jgi:hypothetical protein
MWRKAWFIGISAALAACVFGATAGFSEDTPPPRVRGTLDQVNGNMLTIKTRSGLVAHLDLLIRKSIELGGGGSEQVRTGKTCLGAGSRC